MLMTGLVSFSWRWEGRGEGRGGEGLTFDLVCAAEQL